MRFSGDNVFSEYRKRKFSGGKKFCFCKTKRERQGKVKGQVPESLMLTQPELNPVSAA